MLVKSLISIKKVIHEMSALFVSVNMTLTLSPHTWFSGIDLPPAHVWVSGLSLCPCVYLCPFHIKKYVWGTGTRLITVSHNSHTCTCAPYSLDLIIVRL